MDNEKGYQPTNLQCSSKTVSKTDVCTNCYSKICSTCQIREDFLFHDRSSGLQRSELFIDEIYTCNKCDQTWMDSFTFCFNCSRVICKGYQERHDECPKVYNLMKSDIIKRRRLTETTNELVKFTNQFEKRRSELNETCQKWNKSQFLTQLKNSKSSFIAKIEEIERFYISDANLFIKQLSSLDLLLKQHGETLEDVKSRFEHTKRKQVFPVQFLLELTDLEYRFRILTQAYEKVDISSLKDTQIFNVDCRPKEVEMTEIKTLLGIEGIKGSNVSSTTVNNDKETKVPGIQNCRTLPEENCPTTETKEPHRSQTLPTRRTGNESSYYKISILEKELKLKDEQIAQLTADIKSLKNQIYLVNRSRKAAKERLQSVDTQIKELVTRHEIEWLNVQESHQKEKEELQKTINQISQEAIQVKSHTDKQMKEHQDEVKDLSSRHNETVQHMYSEIESLRAENKELKRTLQQSEDDSRIVKQNAEENTERYNTHLQKNVELIRIQNLQIEELQNLVRCLEKEKEGGSLDNTRLMRTENQKIKEKLYRVKRMFDHWSSSSSSLNSMMAHELRNEDIAIDALGSTVCNQQDSEDMQISPDRSEPCTSQKTVYNESSQSADQSTTVVTDVTTERDRSKHITSITYNAKQIHLIQNSQVSLADSGFDNVSFFGEREEEMEGEEKG